MLGLHAKICPLEGIWGLASPTFLFWDLLHISETDRVRKFKFGKLLVGIYEYYGSI